MTDIVTINGVDYAPIANRPTGTRAVVVVDRGWIFAGDGDGDGYGYGYGDGYGDGYGYGSVNNTLGLIGSKIVWGEG